MCVSHFRAGTFAARSGGFFPDGSFAVSARLSRDRSFAVTTAGFSPERSGVHLIITGIGSHRMPTTGMGVIPVMAMTGMGVIPVMAMTGMGVMPVPVMATTEMGATPMAVMAMTGMGVIPMPVMATIELA